MVVLVVTGLRAALEMTRVSRMRVVGKGSGSTPKDIVSASMSAVINNVIRRFIFSHPLSVLDRKLLPKTAKQRPTTPFFRWGSRLRHWLDPSPLQAPISYGNGFLGLYPDVYDPFKLATGDESPMNPRRSSNNSYHALQSMDVWCARMIRLREAGPSLRVLAPITWGSSPASRNVGPEDPTS